MYVEKVGRPRPAAARTFALTLCPALASALVPALAFALALTSTLLTLGRGTCRQVRRNQPSRGTGTKQQHSSDKEQGDD